MKAKLPLKPRLKSQITKRPKTSLRASIKAAASTLEPPPPRRILVPADFSPDSNRALDYARSFARHFNARIIFIHVVEAFPIDYLAGLESAKEAN